MSVANAAIVPSSTAVGGFIFNASALTIAKAAILPSLGVAGVISLPIYFGYKWYTSSWLEREKNVRLKIK